MQTFWLFQWIAAGAQRDTAHLLPQLHLPTDRWQSFRRLPLLPPRGERTAVSAACESCALRAWHLHSWQRISYRPRIAASTAAAATAINVAANVSAATDFCAACEAVAKSNNHHKHNHHWTTYDHQHHLHYNNDNHNTATTSINDHKQQHKHDNQRVRAAVKWASATGSAPATASTVPLSLPQL